jgi:D-alanyl-D-alanine carboxypeptidase
MRIQKLVLAFLSPILLWAAEPQIPDKPSARQAVAYLKALNDGDRAGLKEFLEKNYPGRAGAVDRQLDFRRRTGGFDLRKVEEATATKFSGLAQERDSDQFVRITIEVESAAPYRITQMNLLAIPRPPEFAIAPMSESAVLAELRARIEKDAAADHFSGTVAIAKYGRIAFSAAYGLADRENKIANKLDTRFRIGSMNKMFTAAAILQLVQDGKIALTDPLGKYLTGYPNKDVASKVTIHHLLTHTGGTGDIFGPQFTAHRLELRTLNDYVKLYGERGLKFEPGSRWEYSNYGFLLLGVVIEKVTGGSYYDYVRDRVFNSSRAWYGPNRGSAVGARAEPAWTSESFASNPRTSLVSVGSSPHTDWRKASRSSPAGTFSAW